MVRALILSLALAVAGPALAQRPEGRVMDYGFTQEYEIGGITVSGTEYTDPNAVKLFSGLQVGDKITVPGDRISKAVRNLWEQKLFADVRIEAAEIRGKTIFLHIIVQERPRLSRFKFTGVSKSEADKLREEIRLIRGQQVNEAILTNTRHTIRRYFMDKGYLKADADIVQRSDTLLENSVLLVIGVDKGPRVRIHDVVFEGNEAIADAKLRKAMRKTKRKRWYNVFGSSKYVPKEVRKDLAAVVDKYNEEGYRNAQVVGDTFRYISKDKIEVEVTVDEGQRFYFRDITFTGNTKYSTDTLQKMLGIRRGDVYNRALLDARIYGSGQGFDVSSMYMDRGYLSFYADPVEFVEGDSIDLEVRLREGKQYRVRNVSIRGNSKTFDHVVRREIRTRPGDLFDRSDVIRTQRELANLGYFDPEKLGVNPSQDDRSGEVDLEYVVEERPSDRLELSGGWGAGRLVVSLGLSFTNFSMRNLFNGKAWTPLPAGDGQTLNLRVQTNGRFFQSYSMSFVEPWLGGRKPNALSFSLYHSVQTNGEPKTLNTSTGPIDNPLRQSLLITGATLGLGRRLQWPDDYFLLRQTVSYQLYDLRNWNSLFSFNNGTSNVLAYQVQFSRNSVDQPFFARTGSEVLLSVKLTPPWSLIGIDPFSKDVDFDLLTDAERYRWSEFHKWKFTTTWYNWVTRSKTGHGLVLMLRAGVGLLGEYNARLGRSP
ncbi:MAG: outer membrane protein assembly factor BamA, partial [Flavobacteriales bacterium]|nr:outer membrane protein assembly factor BamA [Flavobacteriales bacterium]